MFAATVETGQRNMAALEQPVIKDNTLMPGEWYGGQLHLAPPTDQGGGPKTYSIVWVPTGMSLMWPKDRPVHDKTAKAKGCGSYLLSCLAGPGAEVEVVTLTERWKSPSAVVDNCIMNVALIAVLRGDVGARRSYAVGVLRVHVVQKIKASSLRLTCADHRADTDDCGESEESDARGFHVRHSCPYGCKMQLIERGYLQRTKLYVIEVTLTMGFAMPGFSGASRLASSRKL
jgi:hypothetical protein